MKRDQPLPPRSVAVEQPIEELISPRGRHTGTVSLDRRFDTVIIGGGQAGLAMSRVLQDLGRDHVILERARVAERWKSERWDGLRFQFPNWTIELPGDRYSGTDPDGF